MSEDTWRVELQEMNFIIRWLRYEQNGKVTGCTIIVKNGSQELNEAIKKAWQETEGKYTK